MKKISLFFAFICFIAILILSYYTFVTQGMSFKVGISSIVAMIICFYLFLKSFIVERNKQ